jgi:hypothetical protein
MPQYALPATKPCGEVMPPQISKKGVLMVFGESR